MRFNKLIISNYKSFQFPTEIWFSSSNSEKNIFLIGGMNGSGKTTILEAINICLYGSKSELIFNNFNRKEFIKGNLLTYVEFHLLTDENEYIQINRSWKALNNNSTSRNIDENLSILLNGKDFITDNKSIMQDYINSLIPKEITQFFFFDGEKIQEIAGDDHSEIRLKKSLEAVLGIHFISQLSSDISYLMQTERRKFVEVTDTEIQLKENQLHLLRLENENKRKNYSERINELGSLEKSLTDTKRKMDVKFGFNLDNIEKEKIRREKSIQLVSKKNELDNLIKINVEKYLAYSLAYKFFPDLKKQIELQKSFTQKLMIGKSGSELANKVLGIMESPFPIIGRTMSSEEKIELFKRLIAIFDEYNKEDYKQVLNLSDLDATKVLLKIEEIENFDINSFKASLAQKNEIQIELSEYEREDFNLINLTENENFKQLQVEFEGYATQVGRKKEEIRVIEDEILKSEKEINIKENELSKLYDKFILSRNKSAFLKECDDIINLLDSFIMNLRKNKIYMLKEKTLEMYKLLSSKGWLIKEINVDEDTYEISILDINNQVVKKSSLSAGEKEIFAISLLWGLSKTSELSLPIIIDTPLSRLDSEHRDRIISSYFPNAGDQVIILSTDTEVDNDYYVKLEPFLDNAIKLVFNQDKECTIVNHGYFWNY